MGIKSALIRIAGRFKEITSSDSLYSPGGFRTRSGNTGGGDVIARSFFAGPAGFVYLTDSSGNRIAFFGGEASPADYLAIGHGSSPSGGGTDDFNLDLATGAISVARQFTAAAGLVHSGAITDSISGTVNDWEPSGLVTGSPTTTGASLVRATLTSDSTVTGLSAAQVDGTLVSVQNRSGFALTFAKASAGSAAANRFEFAANITLQQYDTVTFRYNGSRWNLHQIAPGAIGATFTDTGISVAGGSKGGVAIVPSTATAEASGISLGEYSYPNGGTDWELWVYPIPASGTFTLDVRKRSPGNTAPSASDSICATALPSITGDGSTLYASGSLATWTDSPINRGDMLTIVPTVNTANVSWWCLLIPARRSF